MSDMTAQTISEIKFKPCQTWLMTSHDDVIDKQVKGVVSSWSLVAWWRQDSAAEWNSVTPISMSLIPLQLRSAPSSGFLLQNSQSTHESKLAKINFNNIQWTFFNILTLSKFGEGIGPLVMQFIWNTFLISYCFICSLTVQLWIQNYRHLGYCWLKKSFHNGQGLLPKHSIQPESQNFASLLWP